MPENTPTPPGGALPPRPAEAAKVQPKKETVRINLPPKPTSAPTIKLPTLAPGGPPPATTAAAAPVAASAAAAPAATAPKPPSPPPTGGAPAARVAAPAAAPAAARPMAAPMPQRTVATALSGMDKGLAIASGVVSLLAAGAAAYLAWMVYTPPVP